MKPETEQFKALVLAARVVARAAVEEAVEKHKAKIKGTPNERHYDHYGACGFAWVEIISRGRTPFTNAMISLNRAEGSVSILSTWGSRQDWGSKRWEFWNPGEYSGQNVDFKEIGAVAFAKHLSDNGVPAAARSRLD